MRPELVQAAVDTLLTAVSMEFAHGTSAACRRTAHLLRSTVYPFRYMGYSWRMHAKCCSRRHNK
jgi:hypothetical protein